MIDSLASIYVNADETPETLFQRALIDINASGAQGFAVSGITAWDTALWDALGKAQNLSLAEMFGQVRSEVPAYASSGLWLSYSIDELLEEANRFIQQGFRSVKLRVDGQVERDADRAHALRDALGDDIEILVDANQALNVDTAIALARALERYNIGWFEEPVLLYSRTRSASCARPAPFLSPAVKRTTPVLVCSGFWMATVRTC